LRDDIKTWVTANLNALNAKIDEKTIPTDNELSSTSTNPVQNKVITKAINNIPKFSGDYNDLTNAPDISEDGSGNMIIADESGNIIFKADADGIHTIAASIQGEPVATQKYVKDITDSIEVSGVDLTGYATESYVDNAISNIDIPTTDLTGYATETFVTTKIAEAQLEGADIDLSGYATKDDIKDLATEKYVDDMKTELSESILSEQEGFHIVDNEGYIAFSIDENGVTTTTVTAQNVIVDGKNVATETYVDEALANIDIPDSVVLESELTAKGYQTEEQVTALINNALGVIENGTY
jgi:hypothetical protein